MCSPGKFPNNETKICEECDSKCSFCFGLTADNCTQCSGSYVLSNFTCTTSCPSGYKNNANYNVCELTNSGFFSWWKIINLKYNYQMTLTFYKIFSHIFSIKNSICCSVSSRLFFCSHISSLVFFTKSRSIV